VVTTYYYSYHHIIVWCNWGDGMSGSVDTGNISEEEVRCIFLHIYKLTFL
jgi:hypothetical protein